MQRPFEITQYFYSEYIVRVAILEKSNYVIFAKIKITAFIYIASRNLYFNSINYSIRKFLLANGRIITG